MIREEDILGGDGCENPEERPRVLRNARQNAENDDEQFKVSAGNTGIEDGRIDIIEEYEATIGV